MNESLRRGDRVRRSPAYLSMLLSLIGDTPEYQRRAAERGVIALVRGGRKGRVAAVDWDDAPCRAYEIPLTSLTREPECP